MSKTSLCNLFKSNHLQSYFLLYLSPIKRGAYFFSRTPFMRISIAFVRQSHVEAVVLMSRLEK